MSTAHFPRATNRPNLAAMDSCGPIASNGRYRTGAIEIDASQRCVLIDGKPAKLGGRAFDVLLALIERRERIVPKRELMEIVWPKLVVEEGNLLVHMVALRKLLGPRAIATIPGRGYRFMMPVEGGQAEQAEAQQRAAVKPADAPHHPAAGNAPARPPELYGRKEDCAAVQALIEGHPLVSIVGAAGIGKTRLGLAVACALATSAPDGVWVVECASLND